jgi:uncharacterized membrane protein YcaP (DUF421 family)
MWQLTTPWYELIFRAICVFTFLVFLLRVSGKKHFGQITTFDFILLLIISEAVQNALVSDDKSVTAGFITISTLVVLNILMDRATALSTKIEEVLDGRPMVIIKDGKIDIERMKRENITMNELSKALREGGALEASEVRQATLETDGAISVVLRI